MTTETMELTNFHLGRSQKLALKERAKAKGTNVAEEIRNAIDAYLTGVSPEELELLEIAARQAASGIAEMNAMLEATNRKADRVFAEMAKLRGGHPVGGEDSNAAATPVKKQQARAAH
jgi:hypothetical protein